MNYTEILNITLNDSLIILSSYLVGGISLGYLLVRILRGVDLRTFGSGSLGATNTGRILGRKWFYFTLLIDILKGVLVVLLARSLEFPQNIVCAVVVAVIAGHIWPLWLHFHGGKGIATSLGAFVALDYKILLMGGVVLLITYLVSRKFLLSWIATLLAMPLIAYFIGHLMPVIISLLTSTVIIIIAHKNNIMQAWFTTENKA